MQVVVTGATSFLGAAVVKRLLALGHSVYAVMRPGSFNRNALPAAADGLTILEMELEELDQIADRIGQRCEYFFHFGWDGSGSANREKRQIQQKNVTDSVKALKGARALGCRRFLFSGSQAEYGQCREAMREEQECAPVSEYGIAKTEFYRQAIEMCRRWREEDRKLERGRDQGPDQRQERNRSQDQKPSAPGFELEYIHARIFSVYGPGDHPWSLVNSCLDTFLAGGHMELGACTQLWNFLYVDDLTEGLLALMFHPGRLAEDGLYNLAGAASETRPLRRYVEEMHRLCGGRGDFTYGKLPPNAEGPANLIPDITRIQAVTGWKPKVSFQEGISRMVAEKQARR